MPDKWNFIVKINTNPVRDLLDLNITTPRREKVNIQIFNERAVLVKSMNQLICNKGDNFLTTNVSGLGNGLYFLKISNMEYHCLIKFIKL